MTTVEIRTVVAGIEMDYTEFQQQRIKALIVKYQAKNTFVSDKGVGFECEFPRQFAAELEIDGIEVDLE